MDAVTTMRDPAALAVRSSMRLHLALSALVLLVPACSERSTSLVEDPRFLGGEVVDSGRGERGDPLVTLGQALFFDPELSGNRDISCGSCHVPFLSTAEGLELAIGHGATDVGTFRRRLDGAVIARHTLDLFHRVDMNVLFWDGRVERLPTGEVVGPVPTPEGILHALELASIVPLLDRHEMRGDAGDSSFDGRPNELATIDEGEPFAIWEAIATRLRVLGAYDRLFAEAFGDPEITITRIAIALASFQADLWGPMVRVSDGSFDPVVAEGEALFFGDAGCGRCHSGPRFTDERFHDLAVPAIGPGFADAGGLDEGRYRVTRVETDRFAFRTPPLRNVALTPPYMHDGTIATLEQAIRHHFDPVASLRAYTGDHLPATLRATLVTDEATLAAIEANVADSAPLRPLTDDDVALLVAFLESLTNPSELTRSPDDGVPTFVPSGLFIDRWNGAPHPFRP